MYVFKMSEIKDDFRLSWKCECYCSSCFWLTTQCSHQRPISTWKLNTVANSTIFSSQAPHQYLQSCSFTNWPLRAPVHLFRLCTGQCTIYEWNTSATNIAKDMWQLFHLKGGDREDSSNKANSYMPSVPKNIPMAIWCCSVYIKALSQLHNIKWENKYVLITWIIVERDNCSLF
jgi:hypothetical protein